MPLIAVDDIVYLSRKQITISDTVWINDILNVMIDTIGSNMRFKLIKQGHLDNGNSFSTLGDITIDSITGVIEYTKKPNFYGRDYVQYEIRNRNMDSRCCV